MIAPMKTIVANNSASENICSLVSLPGFPFSSRVNKAAAGQLHFRARRELCHVPPRLCVGSLDRPSDNLTVQFG